MFDRRFNSRISNQVPPADMVQFLFLSAPTVAAVLLSLARAAVAPATKITPSRQKGPCGRQLALAAHPEHRTQNPALRCRQKSRRFVRGGEITRKSQVEGGEDDQLRCVGRGNRRKWPTSGSTQISHTLPAHRQGTQFFLRTHSGHRFEGFYAPNDRPRRDFGPSIAPISTLHSYPLTIPLEESPNVGDGQKEEV